VPLTALTDASAAALPTGLQLTCSADQDAKLLGLAAAMEAVLGAGIRLDLDP